MQAPVKLYSSQSVRSVCSSRSILRIRSLTCAIFSSYQAFESTEIVTMNNNMNSVPLYEIIDEVIKPTLLTGTDRCTLQDVPRGMKEATFKFMMSLKHVNLAAGNRYPSNGKYEYEYLYQFHIRICQLNEPDYMPLGLHIRVNMNACELPQTARKTRGGSESRRTATNIDCTEYIKLAPIVYNNIAINWIPDGKKYVFAMYLVKKLDITTTTSAYQF